MSAATTPPHRPINASAIRWPESDFPLLVLGVVDPAMLRRLRRGCVFWDGHIIYGRHNDRMKVGRQGDRFTLRQARRAVVSVTSTDPVWADTDFCVIGMLLVAAGEDTAAVCGRFTDALCAGQVWVCQVDVFDTDLVPDG